MALSLLPRLPLRTRLPVLQVGQEQQEPDEEALVSPRRHQPLQTEGREESWVTRLVKDLISSTQTEPKDKPPLGLDEPYFELKKIGDRTYLIKKRYDIARQREIIVQYTHVPELDRVSDPEVELAERQLVILRAQQVKAQVSQATLTDPIAYNQALVTLELAEEALDAARAKAPYRDAAARIDFEKAAVDLQAARDQLGRQQQLGPISVEQAEVNLEKSRLELLRAQGLITEDIYTSKIGLINLGEERRGRAPYTYRIGQAEAQAELGKARRDAAGAVLGEFVGLLEFIQGNPQYGDSPVVQELLGAVDRATRRGWDVKSLAAHEAGREVAGVTRGQTLEDRALEAVQGIRAGADSRIDTIVREAQTAARGGRPGSGSALAKIASDRRLDILQAAEQQINATLQSIYQQAQPTTQATLRGMFPQYLAELQHDGEPGRTLEEQEALTPAGTVSPQVIDRVTADWEDPEKRQRWTSNFAGQLEGLTAQPERVPQDQYPLITSPGGRPPGPHGIDYYERAGVRRVEPGSEQPFPLYVVNQQDIEREREDRARSMELADISRARATAAQRAEEERRNWMFRSYVRRQTPQPTRRR